MSDALDRAVDARIDSFKPGAPPAFEVLEARKRRRDRRHSGAAVASVALLAAGIALVPSALTGHGPRGGVQPTTAAGGDSADFAYHVGITQARIDPGGSQRADLDRCLVMPGLSRGAVLFSSPPQYTGHITGTAAADAFEACVRAVPGTEVTVTRVAAVVAGRCTEVELAFTATWRPAEPGLAGEIRAVNTSERVCDMAGRPVLQVLGQDGKDIGAQQVSDAALRVYSLPLRPGEAASAPIVWPSWCGEKAASGRLRVTWDEGGGEVVNATGPAQPACTHTRVPEQLNAGYFEADSTDGGRGGSSYARPHKCPDGPTGTYDPIAFLMVGDQMYTQVPAAPTAPLLGDALFNVTCRLTEGSPTRGYRLQGGDSALIPAGTPVREVVGFDPAFRVAAAYDGRTALYEADRRDNARTGADVFPGLAEHVVAFTVLSAEDAKQVVAREEDPARVREMTAQLMAAPIGSTADITQRDVFLGLVLDDGTTVTRAYLSGEGVLMPGLTLPAALRDHIQAMLRDSGHTTGTGG